MLRLSEAVQHNHYIYRIEISTVQYVLIIHEVEDYPTWKTIFDGAINIRKDAGEISYQLLKYDRDTNSIVHFSRWSSLENARTFSESSELIEVRKKSGVKESKLIYLPLQIE